jgi:phosphatidylglycerophosphate synthase
MTGYCCKEFEMIHTLTKIDPSLLTPLARKLASWIILCLPIWVTPNQVTLFGLLANLVSSFAFYLASFNYNWFFVSILCLVLNWVSDNLDGELARKRQMTSERGFYLDQIVDHIGATCVFLGIAFASYTNFALVLLALVIYQLVIILTLLQIVMRQRFLLGRLNPAEARLGLIVPALLTYFWPNPPIAIVGHPLGWFDLGLIVVPIALIERVVWAVELYHDLKPPQALNNPGV